MSTKEKIIAVVTIAVVITGIRISFIKIKDMYDSSKGSKGKENIELSIDESEDDYNPPDSILPKDLNDIFKEVVKYEDKNLKLIMKEDMIVSELTENDVRYTSYIEYSEKYDCTTIKESIEDEQPTKILYHFEYGDISEYVMDIMSGIEESKGISKYKVNMVKEEEGDIKLNIKEGGSN